MNLVDSSYIAINESNLSKDGYLRIRKEILPHIKLIHLMSFLTDSNELESSTTQINGITEWITESQPTISISWDWHLQTLYPPPCYAISSEPFSNVMLVSDKGEDLGQLVTNRYLLKLITALQWQKTTASYIEKRH